MTAISKEWVTQNDSAVDPDSPVDTWVMTGFRDNLVHLREWLGASFFAGAVQNHNHDGVNSALVEIGPNAIRNGSFEDGLAGWNITDYTGGSHALNTANDMDGAQCLAITSTSTANGGGKAESGEFRSCTGGTLIGFRASVKASAANISSRGRIIWFDDGQNQISTTDLFSYTNTPTTLTTWEPGVTAPSSARFYKVLLEGGVPGVGSAFGTIYFDGVKGDTGVSSLNGFTGKLVNTDAYSVGSHVIGRSADNATYAVGATLSGGSLYTMSPRAYRSSSAWEDDLGASSAAVTLVGVGSWRCLTPTYNAPGGFPSLPALWVRYA